MGIEAGTKCLNRFRLNEKAKAEQAQGHSSSPRQHRKIVKKLIYFTGTSSYAVRENANVETLGNNSTSAQDARTLTKIHGS